MSAGTDKPGRKAGGRRIPVFARTAPAGKTLSQVLGRIEAEHGDDLARAGVSSAAVEAGELVRAMRHAAGLSQAKLADATGIAQPDISDIERGTGKDGPTFQRLRLIAAACGMRLAAVRAELAAATPAVWIETTDAIAAPAPQAAWK